MWYIKRSFCITSMDADAAIRDPDMDGVAVPDDKCPNTAGSPDFMGCDVIESVTWNGTTYYTIDYKEQINNSIERWPDTNDNGDACPFYYSLRLPKEPGQPRLDYDVVTCGWDEEDFLSMIGVRPIYESHPKDRPNYSPPYMPPIGSG